MGGALALDKGTTATVYQGSCAPKGDVAKLGTLTYGRGAPRPVVNGVLRTPDGVVNLRPKAILRPRKAAGLLRSLVRSPPRRRRATHTVAEKVKFLELPSRA